MPPRREPTLRGMGLPCSTLPTLVRSSLDSWCASLRIWLLNCGTSAKYSYCCYVLPDWPWRVGARRELLLFAGPGSPPPRRSRRFRGESASWWSASTGAGSPIGCLTTMCAGRVCAYAFLFRSWTRASEPGCKALPNELVIIAFRDSIGPLTAGLTAVSRSTCGLDAEKFWANMLPGRCALGWSMLFRLGRTACLSFGWKGRIAACKGLCALPAADPRLGFCSKMPRSGSFLEWRSAWL